MKAISINIKCVNRTNESVGLMAQISYGASITTMGKKRYQQINVALRGCRVPISAWNVLTKQVVGGREYKSIRERVERAKARLYDACNFLLGSNNLSKQTLNDFLMQDEEWCKTFNLESVIINHDVRIYDWGMNWLENDTTKTSGTHNAYISLLNRIVEFEEKQGVKYSFKNFTLPVFHQFVNFIKSRGVGQKSLYYNYVSNLKALFNKAKKQGEEIYDKFDLFIVDAPKEEEKIKRLSEEQIQAIKDLPLYNNMARFRDLFLFECECGCRFSDYIQFNRENIIEVEGYKVCVFNPTKEKNNKTIKKAIVPLSELALTILERYDYNLINSCSSKTFYGRYNDGLHEIGRMVGIGTEKDECGRYIDQLTSHRARHTFICNAIEKGILSDSEIMNITGHKSLTAFKIYAKPNESVIASNLINKMKWNDCVAKIA